MKTQKILYDKFGKDVGNIIFNMKTEMEYEEKYGDIRKIIKKMNNTKTLYQIRYNGLV